MTRAVIHIGLHKTGTTAFQQACAKSRETLAANGVLYPDQKELTFDTVQHLGLVTTLRGNPSNVQSSVDRLAEISEQFDTLLLSSEDFSHFFGGEAHQAASSEAFEALRSKFSEVRYVCAIRDDRAILKSSLREMIEGLGFPAQGTAFVQRQVSSFYARNRRIAATLGQDLTVLSYEALADGNLASNLLREAIGLNLDLPNEVAHTSAKKDARSVLIGSIRMLLFNAEQTANPYTNNINQKLASIVRGISIDKKAATQIDEAFSLWLDRELDAAIAKEPETLAAIYEDRITL